MLFLTWLPRLSCGKPHGRQFCSLAKLRRGETAGLGQQLLPKQVPRNACSSSLRKEYRGNQQKARCATVKSRAPRPLRQKAGPAIWTPILEAKWEPGLFWIFDQDIKDIHHGTSRGSRLKGPDQTILGQQERQHVEVRLRGM